MTVHSQILRCVNNRLRNTDETGKSSSNKKKSVGALILERDVISRSFSSSRHQSEQVSLVERTLESMPEARRVHHSRRPLVFRPQQQQQEEQQQRSDCDNEESDLDDMLVLKRANPVYDSDEDGDEECSSSPLKRQKSLLLGEDLVSSLSWEEQLLEDDLQGFSLSSPVASTASAIGAH